MNDASRHEASVKLLAIIEYGPLFTVDRFTFHVVGFSGGFVHDNVTNALPTTAVTLLGAGGLVPDVVGDGRGRHGEARFAGGGRSYD